MDLNTRIVNALVDHWPLLVGLGVIAWWLLPKILPNVIKDSLSNGGGDIIRKIVQEENAAQSKLHTEELDRRFARHEEDEDERFREIEGQVWKRSRSRRRSKK